MKFNEELLKGYLDNKLIIYDETASTNQIAKELCKSGEEEGTVIIAKSQTSGKGRMGRSSLNTAIVYLEEYKKLPRPNHSPSDLELFRRVIEVIENAPQDTTPATLRKELKKSGLTTMTHDQLEVFINTLGYLDILHPEDSHGMLYTHTPERDMLPAHSFQTYNEHPVNRWKRSDGIDYGSISLLFDGLYDNK